ncbi:MAG: hypothetical protein KatS3mg081_0014 [Gemmatimonadales bacterium]|nr:MAG: hypothetical protein KatS3mg081_0014 [Gemmatimonadales bacterium]
MAELIAQDLRRELKNPETGARELTGDQVLRIVVLKQLTGFSYEALSFHLADSITYRNFCRSAGLREDAVAPHAGGECEEDSAAHPGEDPASAYPLRRGPGDRGREEVAHRCHGHRDPHPPSHGLQPAGRRRGAYSRGCSPETVGFQGWSDHTNRAKRRLLAIQHTGEPQKAGVGLPRPPQGSPQDGGLRRAGGGSARGPHQEAEASKHCAWPGRGARPFSGSGWPSTRPSAACSWASRSRRTRSCQPLRAPHRHH